MSIHGNTVGGLIPTAEQVGARPNTWTPTAEEVGARPNTWTPTATDVGAAKALIEKLVMSYADGHAAPNDLLNVYLTGDRTQSCMQPGYIATEDASTLSNSPVTSGAFYAVRTVEYFSSPGHVTVRLHESYPINGRIWSNMYDVNIKSWYGWKDNYSGDKTTKDYVDNLILNDNLLVKNNYISILLAVDLNDPNSIFNRSGFFDSSSRDLPASNVAFGVRDVTWVAAGFIVVTARCFLTDSSSAVYTCTYNINAGGWLGWNLVYDSSHLPSVVFTDAYGVEYRTTERYKGYPVYIKLIDFGSLPDNNTKSVTVVESGTAYPIECNAKIYNTSVNVHFTADDGYDPYNGYENGYYITAAQNNGRIQVIAKTVQAYSAWNAAVVVKYYKTA